MSFNFPSSKPWVCSHCKAKYGRKQEICICCHKATRDIPTPITWSCPKCKVVYGRKQTKCACCDWKYTFMGSFTYPFRRVAVDSPVEPIYPRW